MRCRVNQVATDSGVVLLLPLECYVVDGRGICADVELDPCFPATIGVLIISIVTATGVLPFGRAALLVLSFIL